MIIYLIIIFFMLILSAFFSGSEIAINSANRIRLRKEAAAGSKTAGLALSVCEDFTSSLCSILIGNNLVNIASSSCATLLFLGIIKNDAVASVVSTVVMTVVVLIFGEILPKALAKQHADRIVLIIIFPIRILTLILFPIVFIITLLIKGLTKIWGTDSNTDEPTLSEEDISSVIETVEEEGVIDEEKSQLLKSTLDFHDTTVGEIMTHRIDMTSFDICDSPENIRNIIDSSKYSRIPVYEDTVDNIIGVLFLNHYYKALTENGDSITNEGLRTLLFTPPFIHKTMKLPVALDIMRENKIHIAIVIDEFGGTMGIVTMEDILEELVGDIWDESDDIVNEYKKTDAFKYEIAGDMNIDDFFALVDISPVDFECEYSTMGGWAIEALDAQPHVGDVFRYENLTITVTGMDDLRVTKLSVTVTPVATSESDDLTD